MDEFKNHVKEIDNFIYPLIATPPNTQKFDLLSQFKQLVDKDRPESKKWLRDIIANFAIAGRDTTAAMMTWTIYCLINHPEVLEKLNCEFVEVFQSREPTLPSVSDLPNLKYLGHVLSETLRLYPSVPFVTRFAQKDDILPDGTRIEGGAMVSYTPYFMGRDPERWEDAEIFIPERWQDKNLTHPFQYVPFHVGPMQCLGRHMALKEAKTLLSILLQRYSFSLDPTKPVVPYLGILLTVENGLHVKVKKK
eukprot:TRINITY_DN1917_c0_g1_i7.p1 TRINITY_DN1917_c0_g1~~TRINITY_DN1917_c0_g1_i7.p1  ORF type:complete len:250 (-),score=63.37 TRINITY_DN1917_c0_g1_i7:149-898(-)